MKLTESELDPLLSDRFRFGNKFLSRKRVKKLCFRQSETQKIFKYIKQANILILEAGTSKCFGFFA